MSYLSFSPSLAGKTFENFVKSITSWDYTCRNTLADSYKKHTAVEVGYAAKEGEKDKYDNYIDLVNENYYVVPIAHETMGSWAPDSLKFEGFGIKNL